MPHLRPLALIAFSLVLQATQAAIPENEQAALTAILKHADPEKLQSWPEIDENICTQPQITCDEQQSHIVGLSLNHLGLKQLASEIAQFTVIEELVLSVNELHVLPIELWQLVSLRTLKLSANNLSHIPPEISQLRSLGTLSLSGNDLSSIPPEIGQLTALETLVLAGNALTSIPPEIGQLRSLTSLSLSFNDITQLPPEIGQLTALTKLGLSGNSLVELPKEIGQLTALESINLRGSPLKDLPAEFTQLTALNNLSLGDVPWTEIPVLVFQLPHLNYLSISSSQISVLSPEIANLTALTRLQIMNSELTSLPKEIGQLKMLTYLQLSNNKLSSLPSEIGSLDKLENLRLYENQLKTIPEEIGQLTALKKLQLDNNQIERLPLEINQLTSLEHFSISSNQLKSLPEELGGLASLQSLMLTDNQLTSLPASIGQLASLVTLNVSDNQLNALPAEMGQLANLTYLHLQNNKLRAIPSEIVALTGLGVLDLSSNQLTALPKQLGQLLNLSHLELSNNLLSSLPDSLTQTLGGINPFCGLDCSRVPLALSVQDNCLSDAALSPSLLEWLNSDAVSTSPNWPAARLKQHDICAKHTPLLAFTSERSEHSEQVDFINTESIQPVAAGAAISYTLYPTGEANLVNSDLSTGQVTLVDNIWRIDTEGLAEGEYEVVFSTENDLFVTGIQAWSHAFIKAYEESHIADELDLTPSFALNSSVDFPELSPALNLDHALFSEATPLLIQLRQIPDLAGLHTNTERLYWNNDDASKQYNVRPFAIKKAVVETESNYQITSDGLQEFTTDYQRIVTAAPAVSNLSAFKIALSHLGLSLDNISSSGRILARENNTSSQAIYYSARADLVSMSTELVVTTPGLYYTTAHNMPNVPLYNHIYPDDQGRLMQQAIYATPYDWQAFKAELLAHGFSHITIAVDGLISGEISGRQYRAYMAYDVQQLQRTRHNTEGLTPVEDLNGDGYQDMQIIFSAGESQDQYVFKQNIYVVPVE